MIDIKPSIARGWGKGELYDILVQLQNGMLPISGRTYYVSTTGNNTTGLSWENAFKTIASAIAASNTYIALTENQFSRNRIYLDGGTGGWGWEETLTVFPNKCDLVGVGATFNRQVMITGKQGITTACFATHIYNINFYNPTTSVPVVQLNDNTSGIEFYNCTFQNGSGNDSSVGLKFGIVMYYKVKDCQFIGNPPPVIGIEFAGTKATFGEIANNVIHATTTGISIAAANTTNDYQLLIKDNVITRSDPGSQDQLTTGIAVLNTVAQSHVMIVKNYISAEDAIAFTNAAGYAGRDEWCCIGNWINEGETATTEDSIATD